VTFDEIVDKVKKKLNLTSTDATDRIGERVNELYRTVTSSIGLETSRRVETSVSYDSDVDTDLPYIEVTGMEKILTVRLETAGNIPKTLEERNYDDIKGLQTVPPHNQDPQAWAVFREDYNSVTIIIDAFPDGDPFTLEFEGIENATTLATTDVPAFPESFHDLLVEGARAEELLKMEKAGLAEIAEKRYQQRVSDLRYFLAKSQWLDQVQGKIKRRHIRGSTVINDG
jgi:hypothetical protein